MLKKIISIFSFLLLFNNLNAQVDSTKKTAFSISGSLDAYFRYNLNAPDGKTNNFTSFSNSQNSFEIGMATIKTDHQIGKVSASIDVGFGRRAQDFSYNDIGTSLALLKQATLSYQATEKLTFTFGKWATHIGYELVDAVDNKNYSMSYGFSFGPYFHTGLKASYALGEKTAFMIGFADPTDYSTTNSAEKVFLAQLSSSSKNDKIKAYLNLISGRSSSQYNIMLMASTSEKLNIVFDGSINSTQFNTEKSSWKSAACYINYFPSNAYGITLRTDYFSDRSNSPLLGGASSIFATTLSGNLKIQQLTIIPEFRFDNSSDFGFINSKNNAAKNTATFILAATYKF